MRIANITPQYFTRFRDDNARKVVRETCNLPPEEDYMQPCCDGWFNDIDKCEFVDVYTDPQDGEIKIACNEKFLKEHDLEEKIECIKRERDFGNVYAVHDLASYIMNISDAINGIIHEYKPVHDYRYYETEEEQQERRLTYLAQ